ncbi:MAG: hypothetical protein AB9869_38110 [Verrucomicrobiia bacterium]
MKMILLVLLGSMLLWDARSEGAEPAPVFKGMGDGGFAFDTGVLRGKLHPDGKSLGLVSVVHVPSGKRLDSSNGLLSHYRVFTKGVRYGGGAWDWPSEASLTPDGAVEIRWAAADRRPFAMRAVYRWRDTRTLDLETVVEANADLAGFESFVASYFSEPFVSCAVLGGVDRSSSNLRPTLLPAEPQHGAWQMFPRNQDAVALIQDGRWKLEPHPVDWTIRPFTPPAGVRRDPSDGLSVTLMSLRADCFAVSSPHEAEGHRSLYFSLFGRDVKAGGRATARMRLIVTPSTTASEIAGWYAAYSAEQASRTE